VTLYSRRVGKKIRTIVGIDEAGRGPLAGPVAVGIAAIPSDFDWGLLPGVNDSKLLTPKKREAVFNLARNLKKERKINYCVCMVSAKVIDRVGIVHAVRLGIARACNSMTLNPEDTFVKLDGLLRAPDSFIYQETIVKGDAKEKIIGLASIVAKVTRDRYMSRLAKYYPEYGFELHKGYGTPRHRAALLEHRLSPAHRMSFCRGFTE
jgi:ribonuclease HII